MENLEISNDFVFAPHIFCPECSHGVPVETFIGVDYFRGELQSCPTCQKGIDWQFYFRKNLEHPGLLSAILGPIGAHLSIFNIKMIPNTMFELRFKEYGIPEGSRILEMTFGSISGGLFPNEFMGNPPRRTDKTNVVYLYPMPLPGSKIEDSTVSVTVTWIPASQNDENWESIRNAYELYGKKDFKACIVPANVSVESKLAKIVKAFLENFASAKRIKTFMLTAATYVHQLNVILPIVISQTTLPKFPDAIRQNLNRLLELRNEIAHDGKFKTGLKAGELASLIASSLIAFHYLNILENELSSGTFQNKENAPPQKGNG
jgi:hypothetical protein